MKTEINYGEIKRNLFELIEEIEELSYKFSKTKDKAFIACNLNECIAKFKKSLDKDFDSLTKVSRLGAIIECQFYLAACLDNLIIAFLINKGNVNEVISKVATLRSALSSINNLLYQDLIKQYERVS